MKHLLLLRHAKSDNNDLKVSDHQRTLNDRGRRDAPRMGRLLREQNLMPDLVVTSSATRATETADAVVEESGYDGTVEQTARLYHAYPADYLSVLRELPDECDRVMLVGHNPGFEALVTELTGARVEMPTAAIAQIDLPVQHWDDLDGNTQGELLNVWRPRELSQEVK